nr:glycosyltransferase [Prochlorococcus marinus]
MKIIVIGPEYSGYNAASYQFEFMNALRDISDNYYHYFARDAININTLISKANFIPDLIFYNHGWLQDNPSVKMINYGIMNKESRDNNIKHVIFLNKEYTRLKEKLNFIKKYKFDLIFTHLHNFENLNNTSIVSKFLPLACSYENISPNKYRKLVDRKYDLFFSGILQNWNFKNKQSDLRKKIQSEFFYCICDFPLLKKIRYWDLNIYWKPFYKNRFKNIISNFLHGKRLTQKEYFNILSDSKSVLHTSSPMGIISTRVFEALGSGAVGLFSMDSNSDFIFKNGIHYVSFSGIKDLIHNLYLIKKTKVNSRFQIIANTGRKCVENNHTWKNRVAFFVDEVLKL